MRMLKRNEYNKWRMCLGTYEDKSKQNWAQKRVYKRKKYDTKVQVSLLDQISTENYAAG